MSGLNGTWGRPSHLCWFSWSMWEPPCESDMLILQKQWKQFKQKTTNLKNWKEINSRKWFHSNRICDMWWRRTEEASFWVWRVFGSERERERDRGGYFSCSASFSETGQGKKISSHCLFYIYMCFKPNLPLTPKKKHKFYLNLPQIDFFLNILMLIT